MERAGEGQVLALLVKMMKNETASLFLITCNDSMCLMVELLKSLTSTSPRKHLPVPKPKAATETATASA